MSISLIHCLSESNIKSQKQALLYIYIISLTNTTSHTDKPKPKYHFESCMQTDTHACTESLVAKNLIFDMLLPVAKQHLLQEKYETEKSATLKIIFSSYYSSVHIQKAVQIQKKRVKM